MNSTSSHPNSTFNAAALNSFYRYLSTAGFVPLVALLVSIRALVATVGIVLNCALVWATVSNKTLRSSCNYLIALNSLALAVYEFGFFPMWAIVMSGQNLVRLSSCFWAMALPVLGKNFSQLMMVLIALDRLKIVLFPFLNRKYERHFVLVWGSICLAFGLYGVVLSFIVMRRVPSNAVMCAASEVAQQEAAAFAQFSSVALNYASPAVYCILGVLVYLRKPKNATQQGNRRFFKSIFVLMMVEVCGWGTNSLSVLFFQAYFSSPGMSDMTKWAINAAFSLVLIVATAANAPALYFCNSEYKNAFLKLMRSCAPQNGTQQTPVVPFTGSQQPR